MPHSSSHSIDTRDHISHNVTSPDLTRSPDHKAALENDIVEMVQADLSDDDHLDRVLGTFEPMHMQ